MSEKSETRLVGEIHVRIFDTIPPQFDFMGEVNGRMIKTAIVHMPRAFRTFQRNIRDEKVAFSKIENVKPTRKEKSTNTEE